MSENGRNMFGSGYRGPLRAAVVERPHLQFVYDPTGRAEEQGGYVEAAEHPHLVERLRVLAQAVVGFVEPTLTADKMPPNRLRWDPEAGRFRPMFRAPFMPELNLSSKTLEEMTDADWNMVSPSQDMPTRPVNDKVLA